MFTASHKKKIFVFSLRLIDELLQRLYSKVASYATESHIPLFPSQLLHRKCLNYSSFRVSWYARRYMHSKPFTFSVLTG